MPDDTFFLCEHIFGGIFSAYKRFRWPVFICCFSLINIDKSCSKLETLCFLIKNCVLDLSCIWFSCFCFSDQVSDIWVFTCGFYCGGILLLVFFTPPCFISIVTIIFTMFVSCPIKSHLLISVSRWRKLKLTISIIKNVTFSEYSWESSTKTGRKYWWGKIEIHCFENYDTIYVYLGYSKVEKSRMFNEYYQKLFSKYFSGGKKIWSCLVSVWVCLVNCLVFLFGTFFLGIILDNCPTIL